MNDNINESRTEREAGGEVGGGESFSFRTSVVRFLWNKCTVIILQHHRPTPPQKQEVPLLGQLILI